MALVAGIEQQQTAEQSSGLERLIQVAGEDLQAVNRIILDHMQSEVELIPQLAGHIIAAGGKRLRPLLTLGSARLCDYSGKRHLSLAACVEFIHTATLLHDDVIDESDLRRGLATANSVWGNKPSVLVGDFLFSRAFQLMVADGSIEVLRILSDASAVIAEGEVLQLITSNDTETTEASYLRVVGAKTAALFAAACEIGAVVAERTPAEQSALRHYGQSFGIAFQLVDDILDYSARQAELGKTIGDDFREGKITLPVILAIRRSDASELAFWRRCLEDLDQGETDLAQALVCLDRHDCLADSMAQARGYANEARAALEVFPKSQARRALTDLVDFCIERSF